MAAASGMNSAGLDVRCYLQREGGLAAVLRAKKVCGRAGGRGVRSGEFVWQKDGCPSGSWALPFGVCFFTFLPKMLLETLLPRGTFFGFIRMCAP